MKDSIFLPYKYSTQSLTDLQNGSCVGYMAYYIRAIWTIQCFRIAYIVQLFKWSFFSLCNSSNRRISTNQTNFPLERSRAQLLRSRKYYLLAWLRLYSVGDGGGDEILDKSRILESFADTISLHVLWCGPLRTEINHFLSASLGPRIFSCCIMTARSFRTFDRLILDSHILWEKFRQQNSSFPAKGNSICYK